ncbi:MAG: HAD-IIIA family hydrolase [Treponema sp.]|nr:HAD-IIIA family hydrolase [Treponema sp.]
MKAVIMAGGKGTRIASMVGDVPKPMIRICGKPILQWEIECLARNKITDITIVIGHLGHFIREYFADGAAFGVKIDYYEETEPLGTAGALYRIPGLDEDFLLLNGDTIFDIDFSRFIAFHRSRGATEGGMHCGVAQGATSCATGPALASLMTHPNSHPYDSALIETEILPPQEEGGIPCDSHRVVRWLNKEDDRLWCHNRVNAGIQIVSPALLAQAAALLPPEKRGGKLDLDRDILKPAVASGGIYAYDSSEYVKDMGTPDRFHQVEADIRGGLVGARNLGCPQKAFFLDRDGTINRSSGFLTDINDMELLPGAAEAVRRINESGYLAIVVTNQPQIARGELDFAGLSQIHDKMETLLGREGAFLDAVYFCPHHPDAGFPGERTAYKRACSCRKPEPGMLLQAAADFHIDVSSSFMIGDSWRDEESGRRAGCKKSVRLSEGRSLLDAVTELLNA